MRTVGNLSQYVRVLALARLFDKHGLIWFQRFDQQFCRLGADGTVKINGEINFGTCSFPQRRKSSRSSIDKGFVLDDPGRSPTGNTSFECRESPGDPFFDSLGIAAALV